MDKIVKTILYVSLEKIKKMLFNVGAIHAVLELQPPILQEHPAMVFKIKMQAELSIKLLGFSVGWVAHWMTDCSAANQLVETNVTSLVHALYSCSGPMTTVSIDDAANHSGGAGPHARSAKS